jgi:hypothetical protein
VKHEASHRGALCRNDQPRPETIRCARPGGVHRRRDGSAPRGSIPLRRALHAPASDPPRSLHPAETGRPGPGRPAGFRSGHPPNLTHRPTRAGTVSSFPSLPATAGNGDMRGSTDRGRTADRLPALGAILRLLPSHFRPRALETARTRGVPKSGRVSTTCRTRLDPDLAPGKPEAERPRQATRVAWRGWRGLFLVGVRTARAAAQGPKSRARLPQADAGRRRERPRGIERAPAVITSPRPGAHPRPVRGRDRSRRRF